MSNGEISSQINKHDGENIFVKCVFLILTKKELLEKHATFCKSNKPVRIDMPKHPLLCFKNHNRKVKKLFVVCADFECFTNSIQSCSQNPESSFTEKYQKHTPSGYCLIVKADDSIKCEMEPFIYSKQGEEDNASEDFVQDLQILTNKTNFQKKKRNCGKRR